VYHVSQTGTGAHFSFLLP